MSRSKSNTIGGIYIPSAEVFYRYQRMQMYLVQKRCAQEHGFHPSTTFAEIIASERNNMRRMTAIGLGIRGDSSWSAIHEVASARVARIHRRFFNNLPFLMRKLFTSQ